MENGVAPRRKELGLTMEGLSKLCGVPVSTIGDVEQGREPRLRTAQQIARALDRTVEELWPW